MLDLLSREADKTYTENGAVTYTTTGFDCLDMFSVIGALRDLADNDIIVRFDRAFAEDRDLAMRTLFFARDVRGGLGERRVFRVILKHLAETAPDTVRKNIVNVGEYGRYDDILALMDTPVEADATGYIKTVLTQDMEHMRKGGSVSLMAKWLPSVNASAKETKRLARKIARALTMTDKEYRKTLSSLRGYLKIIENNLRQRDYTFDYEGQPSAALFKYRMAFIRNDRERYGSFLEQAAKQPCVLNTSTLTPYEVVSPIVNGWDIPMSSEERRAVDTTWNSLGDFVNSDNSLVVVDGSASMYWSGGRVLPAAVAQSLAVYFAERNKGAFAGHFITFSNSPRLVEIKGKDIYEKIKYCMSFNECSNTNLEKTFGLILDTAVKYHLKQKDMPSRLIVISDMEFDSCADGAGLTNFENARAMFEAGGYKLPSLVFWNVASRNNQQPVRANDKGVILVSGTSPQVFAMLRDNELDPYTFMMSVLSSERYMRIAA
ncbi:MAG: DUF2828 family protein [Saccharofermentans sp.]|nr:DUF2828 family protein [Saccharofermentans sp.]